MIKKFIKFIIFTFIFFSTILFLIDPVKSKQEIYNVLELWLNKVLLSLVPMYFLSNLLISYPYISKILFPILDKALHFENERSCSLFLLSIITGNPTSSILVIDSVEKKQISVEEGNRLLKCTVLSSPLFIISMVGRFGILLIITTILVNFILFYKKHVVKNYLKNTTNSSNLLSVIDRCPIVMLEILSSMLFISVIKYPLNEIVNYLNINNNLIINYLIDILELTTGLDNISNYETTPLIKLLLSSFLLTSGGITILIEILSKLKKTSLSKTSFIINRILHAILTTIILFIIMIFFV